MHTTSKYIGGHSDIIGGMLAVKDEELMKKLTANRELLGGIVGPMEAWLMIRGLRTMEVRLAAHQAAAMEVAKFLEAHPKVRRVNYPGLPSHPQYELMLSLIHIFSAFLNNFHIRPGAGIQCRFLWNDITANIGCSGSAYS